MLHPAIKKQALPATLLQFGLFFLCEATLRAMVDFPPGEKHAVSPI
jgi:hypothetical protein